MDIKEFISTTLVQIVEGVAQASQRISEFGGAASPDFTARTGDGFMGHSRDGESSPVYGVSFDIAVVVGTSTGAEGGGKLQVASLFSVGGKATTADTEQTTSRIKFVVPLQLPTDAASKIAADNHKKTQEAEMRKANRGNPDWLA